MKTVDSCGSRVVGIAVLIWLLTCPLSAQGQSATPLQRVRTASLDSAIIGRVTVFFASADRARATELAALLDSAATYFQRELDVSFPLHLAVLRPNTWFDPYQEDAPALYGMPWGWIPESLIAVPASLAEGILIEGLDEEADLRRVRFVMLHEYGHLVAKAYLHPQGEQLWSSVRWFEEMIATYFAYEFVSRADPDWARAGHREWVANVQRDPPVPRHWTGVSWRAFRRSRTWSRSPLASKPGRNGFSRAGTSVVSSDRRSAQPARATGGARCT